MSRNFFDEALKGFNTQLQEIDCKFIFKQSKVYHTEDKLKDTYIELTLPSGKIMLCYEINRFSPMYCVPKSKSLIEVNEQIDKLYEKLDEQKGDSVQVEKTYAQLRKIRDKKEALEEQKLWNLVSLDNVSVLIEFIEVIKEKTKLDLSNTIEFFENTAKLGLKESFNRYGSMYENLKQLFTMNEGEYSIGDGDSTTIKDNQQIYLKDCQHPVFLKIEQNEKEFMLYINHKYSDPDINYSEVKDNKTIEWEKVLTLGEDKLHVDKLYFNEIGHLKYLIEPTLNEEEAFQKPLKLKM